MAENQTRALEERIERLEAIVQKNGGEVPDESISRRSWLALLGGGTMGAGLMASSKPAAATDFAASGSGKIGTTANPAAEVNSVSGNFEAVDTEQLSTSHLNNIVRIEPGDDWQAKIDEAATQGNDPRYAGIARAFPVGATYSMSSTTLPITIPENTVLDIRGTFVLQDGDADAWFDLRPESVILTHGAYLDPRNMTGPVYRFDGDQGDFGTRQPAAVIGHGLIESQQSGPHVEFVETTGAAVSNCHAQVAMKNGDEGVRFSSTGGGYVFNNTVSLRGRAGVAGGNIVTFEGDTSHNRVIGDHVQVASGTNRLFSFEGGGSNIVEGMWADPLNATSPVVFDTNVGTHNVVDVDYRIVEGAVTRNSTAEGNIVSVYGKEGEHPQDLQGQTGLFNGQQRTHDGSGAAPFGQAVWSSANSHWVSQVDGTTFS